MFCSSSSSIVGGFSKTSQEVYSSKFCKVILIPLLFSSQGGSNYGVDFGVGRVIFFLVQEIGFEESVRKKVNANNTAKNLNSKSTCHGVSLGITVIKE